MWYSILLSMISRRTSTETCLGIQNLVRIPVRFVSSIRFNIIGQFGTLFSRKKNAPYLYDVVITHALTWPTLTCQWFPDKQAWALTNTFSLHFLIIFSVDLRINRIPPIDYYLELIRLVNLRTSFKLQLYSSLNEMPKLSVLIVQIMMKNGAVR